MTNTPKRRRDAAYRKGFRGALARAIEVVDRCIDCRGDDDPVELPARLREITVEDHR